MIHSRPVLGAERALSVNEVYLCDSGAQYWDGTTDVTRTMHFGTPTQFQKVCMHIRTYCAHVCICVYTVAMYIHVRMYACIVIMCMHICVYCSYAHVCMWMYCGGGGWGRVNSP